MEMKMKETKNHFFDCEILDDLPHQDISSLDAVMKHISNKNSHSIPELAKSVMNAMQSVFQDYIFELTIGGKEDTNLALKFEMDVLCDQDNPKIIHLFPNENLFYITIDMSVFHDHEETKPFKFGLQSILEDAKNIVLDFYFYADRFDMHNLTGYDSSVNNCPTSYFLAIQVDIKEQDTEQFTLNISKHQNFYFSDSYKQFDINTNATHESLANLTRDLSERFSKISKQIHKMKHKIQKEQDKIQKKRLLEND